MTKDIYYYYKRLLIAVIILLLPLGAGVGAYYYLLAPVMAEASAPDMPEPKTEKSGNPIQTTQAPAATAADVHVDTPVNDILMNGSGNDSDYIWIPVPDAVTSSDITIENHYMERQMWVVISNAERIFYDENSVTGNLDGVISAEAVESGDKTILKFMMDKVYEYDTIFENKVLYVKKLLPKEAYDRIVIIDPAGADPEGAGTENSLSPAAVCLDIALKLEKLLEDQDIRIYMTSLDEHVASDEDSIALSASVRPDMYVRIETAFDEDTSVYGTQTVYNGSYFIPGFGSVELADLLEAHVATAIGGKAMGLTPAGDNDAVIGAATVPAAAIKVGYFTNGQENVLLNRDDYRTKIAEGIADAVIEAYER